MLHSRTLTWILVTVLTLALRAPGWASDPHHDVPTLDPEAQAPIDAKLDAFDAEVRTIRAAFHEAPTAPTDVEWVKKKLAHMVEVDQLMRHEGMSWSREDSWSQAQKDAFQASFRSRWEIIDSMNTEDLKLLLEIHGWPKISAFGEEAENDAWLLVQHADRDPDFQKRVLGILETLLPQNETNARNFAYLYDRVAGAENRQQRYGTQGRCVGPKDWDPHPLEEPERVDELRASVGLEPLAEYEKRFVDICP